MRTEGNHFKVELLSVGVREFLKKKGTALTPNVSGKSYPCLSSVLWHSILEQYGPGVVQETKLYHWMDLVRLNHYESDAKRWIFGPPQFVLGNWHIWVVRLNPDDLDQTFATLCTRQVSDLYSELVLMPVAQMAYGTGWTEGLVRPPGPPAQPAGRFREGRMWILLSADKRSSVAAHYAQYAEDITGSLGRPLPDSTYVTFMLSETEFYLTWKQGKKGMPHTSVGFPTLHQNVVCTATSNPFHYLGCTWYQVRQRGTDSDRSPWEGKFRPRNPDLYFSYRLSTKYELEMLRKEVRDTYVIETLELSDPLKDDQRLYPSVDLECTDSLRQWSRFPEICHPEMWCGPYFVSGYDREGIALPVVLPPPSDWGVVPNMSVLEPLFPKPRATTDLYYKKGLSWNRTDVPLLPLIPVYEEVETQPVYTITFSVPQKRFQSPGIKIMLDNACTTLAIKERSFRYAIDPSQVFVYPEIQSPLLK
jgi:hypothetical protein